MGYIIENLGRTEFWRGTVPFKTRQASNWRWAALAAVLLCCLAVAGMIYWRSRSAATTQQEAQTTPVAVAIDLSQAGTTRGGDTSSVPAIDLPRRIINAHVILPYFSPGGNYIVSITTDRAAPQIRHPDQLSQTSKAITVISALLSTFAVYRRERISWQPRTKVTPPHIIIR
jgi:hypothetical protein